MDATDQQRNFQKQSLPLETPKAAGLARFGELASRSFVSVGMAAAIVAPVVALAVEPVVGMPKLCALGGAWVALSIAKKQRLLGAALSRWAGPRTEAQELAAPRAAYWAVVGQVQEDKRHATKLIAGFGKLLLGIVMAKFADGKTSALKETVRSAAESEIKKGFESDIRAVGDAMGDLAKKAVSGSEIFAWKTAVSLINTLHPSEAAALWDKTRFNPQWTCELGSGRSKEKMSFAEALETSVAQMNKIGAGSAAGGEMIAVSFFGQREWTPEAEAEVRRVAGVARAVAEGNALRAQLTQDASAAPASQKPAPKAHRL